MDTREDLALVLVMTVCVVAGMLIEKVIRCF